MKTFLSGLAVAVLAVAAAGAQAQPATFPVKPVVLVVPFTPSSGSDIIARIIAPRLSERWGQPVVVDNKPGASGNLGAQQVAVAPADGHTLLMAINSFTMTPAMYRNMPFDAGRDFAPVAKLAIAGFALAVNPQVPATDMKTLIAYAKQNGGRLNYGTPGAGTPQHLAMELFKSNFGLDIVHVPYKGISGALTGIGGGQVQMMFATVHSMRPYAESGRVRFVAVTGSARNPLVPNVPTFREQGIDVMDVVDAWYGVLAPAHTPPELVASLNRDFVELMNLPDVKESLAGVGLQLSTSTAAGFDALIKHDLVRWKKVIDEAHITAD